MKQSVRTKLETAKDYCDDMNKSTDFMIEYMQNVANVDYDTVMEFLMEYEDEE